MLKDIAKLSYGNHIFVVDKFSGFDKIEFNIETDKFNLDKRIITYFMNIYFSGQTLKLEKKVKINIFNDKNNSWFKTKFTPEYEFLKNAVQNGLYPTFEKSGYKSGESEDILPDIVRWFAKNTNTDYALIGLKEDIKYCLEFIDKYYTKKTGETNEKI
ncbi:MAG: hypothetical protein IKP65_04815 [Alphaproteobacteria bacterium]|nr:hypothetical protein [Alphaproteobacteria bacterium]